MLGVGPPPPPFNFWMPESIFMKLGMHIMASEPIWMAYFVNPSHQSAFLYVCPSIVAKQWLCKNVTAASTNGTTEELWDTSFSVHESRQLLLITSCYFVCLILLHQSWYRCDFHNMITRNNEAMHYTKLNSMAWVRKRTIPTDWATAACRRS
jgi:hypothetical protein